MLMSIMTQVLTQGYNAFKKVETLTIEWLILWVSH